MDVMKKTCTICGEEKPLEDYTNQKTGRHGKRATCRECQNKASRDYKQTERGVELRRKWKRSDVGKENSKRYRERNKEKIKEYTSTDEYRTRHRKSADNQRFSGNRIIALERDGNRCVLCGSGDKLQVHHKDEVGRNKPKEIRNDNLDNLITLCAKCHIEQHNPVLKRWGTR